MIKIVARLLGLAALVGAGVIGVAGPGTRFGLWDYSTGLKLIRDISAPQAVAGVSLPPLLVLAGLALLGAVLAGVTRHPRSALFALVGALVAGGAMAVPLGMKKAVEGNPFIHDVTTDFVDPPQIVAAADLPRKNPPDYRGSDPLPRADDGTTVAEAQQKAFPEIQPIIVNADLNTATIAALKTLKSMGLSVLHEGPEPGDGSGHVIEAVATSTFFGFKDDFIVRLRPEEGGKVRVDLRSESRVGLSDLGANAKRVLTFSEKFKALFPAAG